MDQTVAFASCPNGIRTKWAHRLFWAASHWDVD
jgi:hypothetical protein